MNTFLQYIGWWNFAGSFLMLGFLYKPFGKKVLNDYTRIFKIEFKLDYWGRVWLFWAAGINIFFGLVNIMGAKWNYPEIMEFLIKSDLVAYSIFTVLVIWGLAAKKLGSGAYSVFIIFGGWIAWGIYALTQN